MNNLVSGSISKRLALLVMLAVLPALAVILYGGMEQRSASIENAKRDIQLLTRSMAEIQNDIARSTRQTLSTLALLPAIQNHDIEACNSLLKAVLAQNSSYQNITLTDLDGDVLASGLPTKAVNLRDRKHVREAILYKRFAAGEYILSRVGVATPSFAFANPVVDQHGRLIAVLTIAINLESLLRFYNLSSLPEQSFVAATDHKGIRLLFFPRKEKTNPVGKPIKAYSWELASKAEKPGIFMGTGSDGVDRIFAFQQLRLADDEPPYIYIWAGIPEAHILKAANATLARNLLVMALATFMALFIAWIIGSRTLIAPIKSLVSLTKEFARGNFGVKDELVDKTDEVGKLARAFHDMAEILATNEQALRENEARFRLVLDSLDASVYVADMDTYEILFINAYSRKEFGDITGKICWQHLQKDQSGPCPFCTNHFLLDEDGNPGPIYTWEFQNTRTGKWSYITDRAIKWLDGRIVRLEVATDITEKVRTEQELIKAKKLESVGVLAGGIAHDFNNILVGILGNIDLALHDDRLNDDTRNLLRNAEKASYQARGLTRQLLTFAKGGEPVKETASLIEVVQESANFVLHGDKTACEFSFPDNLWFVEIDKGQVSQVVHNIILNASSAMPDGGIVEVSFKNADIVHDHKMLKKGRYVKISIKDHGIGISTDLLEKIFDPYFSTKKEGSGLGLAISHSIIAKHGGHIAAASTPGQGTTFTIYLPASADQTIPQDKSVKETIITQTLKILVMDDEEVVRDILKTLLASMGHEVILAEEGREAIDTYQEAIKRSQPIDLIIMDLTIPGGMGGKEAIHEILAIDPKAKVIVSSGYSNDPIMANFRNYGFSAAIAKPYKMSELTNVINQLLVD